MSAYVVDFWWPIISMDATGSVFFIIELCGPVWVPHRVVTTSQEKGDVVHYRASWCRRQPAGVERCSEATVVANLGIWRKLLRQSSEGAVATI